MKIANLLLFQTTTSEPTNQTILQLKYTTGLYILLAHLVVRFMRSPEVLCGFGLELDPVQKIIEQYANLTNDVIVKQSRCVELPKACKYLEQRSSRRCGQTFLPIIANETSSLLQRHMIAYHVCKFSIEGGKTYETAVQTRFTLLGADLQGGPKKWTIFKSA